MGDTGLHDLVVFLLAAGLVVPVARRLAINPVLAFLAVGMLVGPYGLTQIADTLPWLGVAGISNVALTDLLAELGVIFLLFMIALELPIARLIEMRRWVFGLGMLQVVVSTAVIAVIAYAFGNSLTAALVVGGALALSSTAIVSQHLLEQRQVGTPVGQTVLGVLLAQDLAVVPMLFLVGALGSELHGAGTTADGIDGLALGASLLLAIAQAVFAIAAIVLLGRIIVRPLYRLVAGNHSSEVFMATTLLVITVTATLTHSAGLSAALGAFLAGLLLAETEYRHEIELIIEPLKGLLMGLFFLSVGMHINLAEVAANPGWLLASVVGLIAIKAVLIAGLARLFAAPTGVSVESGLMLGQGGEFAFVIMGAASAAALVPEATGQFMLILVSATMVLTPQLLGMARRVGQRIQARPVRDQPDPALQSKLQGHAVLVGYGRTGKLISELLSERDKPWVALDLDAVRVAAAQAQGAPLILGDASRPGLLTKLNLSAAAAVVVCTDDHRFSERILLAVRALNPSVPVLMRVHGSEQGAAFVALGATVTVPEVLESGLQLAVELFEVLGIARTDYQELVESQRGRHGLSLDVEA